jgi:hypothetical protein
VHLRIPNNFCNQCFFSFHIKCIFHFSGGQRGQNRCFFCEVATKGNVKNPSL